MFFLCTAIFFYHQCDDKIFANYLLLFNTLFVRVFLKFFFFLAFFYLLHSLYRDINTFIIANVVPSIFFISVYYIFFIKYKISFMDLITISIYYIIYDYIIGNIPFVSITAFLSCVLLIDYCKKRTNNDILLNHYLIVGSCFFVIKNIFECIFGTKIDFISIVTQLLVFNILTTTFYISNAIDKNRRKVVY